MEINLNKLTSIISMPYFGNRSNETQGNQEFVLSWSFNASWAGNFLAWGHIKRQCVGWLTERITLIHVPCSFYCFLF